MNTDKNEVTTTKERVIKASETCPDAKGVLKELFPEVFKENYIWEDITDAISWEPKSMVSGWWITGRYANPCGEDLIEITGDKIVFAWDDLEKDSNFKIDLIDSGTRLKKFRILKRRRA